MTDIEEVPDVGLECFGGPWDGVVINPAPGLQRVPVARVAPGTFARALRGEYLAAVAASPERPPVIVGAYVVAPAHGSAYGRRRLVWEPAA